jgi:EAL domain-containing protein (putative c-di-GMP-specific phosphodiesterase class I)
LRSFPFDKIKIDRCFIEGLGDGNEGALAIVRAVSRLGASLGIATTAEGVETQAQADVVRREGFTEIQGYWLGALKPAAAIARDYVLQQKRRKRASPVQDTSDTGGGVQLSVAEVRPRRQRRARSPRSS